MKYTTRTGKEKILKIKKINQVNAFAHEAYMSLKRLLLYYDINRTPSNTLKQYKTSANKWLKLWHEARLEYDPTDTEIIVSIDGLALWLLLHPQDRNDRTYWTYGGYKWNIQKSKSFLPKDLTELLKEPSQISIQPAQSFWQQVEKRRQYVQMLNSTMRLEQP